MANHRKYIDTTNINITWSKNDTLFLDSIRGKISRGEFMAQILHITQKDQKFIDMVSVEMQNLRAENQSLRKELQNQKATEKVKGQEEQEQELNNLRQDYLKKNEASISMNIEIDGALNWKKIAVDTKFRSPAMAKKWFEARVTPTQRPKTQQITIADLHPGCLYKGTKGHPIGGDL